MVMPMLGYEFKFDSNLQLAVIVANRILCDSDVVVTTRDCYDKLNNLWSMQNISQLQMIISGRHMTYDFRRNINVKCYFKPELRYGLHWAHAP